MRTRLSAWVTSPVVAMADHPHSRLIGSRHSGMMGVSMCAKTVFFALVLASGAVCAEHPLAQLQFRNSGVVRRDMQFRYFDQTVAYVEDSERWNVHDTSMYLYQLEGGKKIDPPMGMRSAVPLGGLGSGTVELRADGSFRDWNIFNNSPASGTKIQRDDALFGIRIRPEGGTARACTLRTHPPVGLPPIAQIEYAGAFPVSRLRFSDPVLAVGADLYAYSEFQPRDADASATPAAVFTFLVRNPTPQAIETSLLFVIPNYTGGRPTGGEFLMFRTEGKDPLSGTIVVRAAGEGLSTEAATASEIGTLWEKFAGSGGVNGAAVPGEAPRYGAVAARSTLRPDETRAITFVLAWHLPFRRHMSQTPGNYYATLYRDAGDVAEKVLSRLDATWLSMLSWQRTVFDNSLPDWLQDALVNSLATMYKTGVRFGDGRWRQWESFSADFEPEHIHFYRVLPYAFFFPDLQKQLLATHARFQGADGFIHEQMTTGSELDEAGGREMGDSATDFLLEAWQIWAWGGDHAYLDSIWPHAKKAAEWQIRRSEPYGLPKYLENTYDWWRFAKKELVSYNAFLHLASMRAAERLAIAEGDQAFAFECRKAFDAGQRSLDEHLWAGAYFRSWWLAGKPFPDALHADTLYGQLWAFLLDLGLTADEAKLKSHLASEAELNGTSFGLRVMRRADPEHPEAENTVEWSPSARDNLIWEAGSLDWCSLNLYLGGDVRGSLAEAEKIVRKWRDKLRDEWDYKDLSTGWDGYPWCNSHYTRQVIVWAIPLALSGQQWNVPARRLTFDPRPGAPTRLPFFTPQANGVIEAIAGGRWRLTVIAGRLELDELRAGTAKRTGAVSLSAGETLEF